MKYFSIELTRYVCGLTLFRFIRVSHRPVLAKYTHNLNQIRRYEFEKKTMAALLLPPRTDCYGSHYFVYSSTLQARKKLHTRNK